MEEEVCLFQLQNSEWIELIKGFITHEEETNSMRVEIKSEDTKEIKVLNITSQDPFTFLSDMVIQIKVMKEGKDFAFSFLNTTTCA